MNVFQLIKSVLDELYRRIPGEAAEKDKLINAQIKSLSTTYAKLSKEAPKTNYADAITRFAYIYEYVTSHANVVYQLVRDSADLRNLFNASQVSVTCIGGGPGSDFLGILKYILRNKKATSLKVNLFDREPAWSESWSDVDDKLGLSISNRFMFFDVTKPETWKPYEKFLSADLFTMIYFMSEISTLHDQAEPFFKHLFENAKTGALLLYVDNRNQDFYGWFDSLVSAHNWKVLMSDQVELKMEDTSEEKKDLEPYYSKFPDPKLKANIAFRICQKQ
jgi:hypothetical protein